MLICSIHIPFMWIWWTEFNSNIYLKVLISLIAVFFIGLGPDRGKFLFLGNLVYSFLNELHFLLCCSFEWWVFWWKHTKSFTKSLYCYWWVREWDEFMYAFNWKFWDTIWVLMAGSFYFWTKAKTMLIFRYWAVKKWKLAGYRRCMFH